MIPVAMRFDVNTWDLELGVSGDLDPTSTMAEYVAQTVANEWRLFKNDAYYFPQEGIPYFENVLGQRPPQALVEAYLITAARSVYGVDEVEIVDYVFDKRLISATGHIWTTDGSEIDVVV